MKLTAIQVQILESLIDPLTLKNRSPHPIIINESMFPFDISGELLQLMKDSLIDKVSEPIKVREFWVSDEDNPVYETRYGHAVSDKGIYEYKLYLKELAYDNAKLQLDNRATIAQETCAAEAKKATSISEKAIDLSKESNKISEKAIELSKQANEIADDSLRNSRRANIVSIASLVVAFASILASTLISIFI